MFPGCGVCSRSADQAGHQTCGDHISHRLALLGLVKALEYTAFLTLLVYIPSSLTAPCAGPRGPPDQHTIVYYCSEDPGSDTAITAAVAVIIALLLLPILLPFGAPAADRGSHRHLLLLFIVMVALELLNLMWLFIIRIQWSSGEVAPSQEIVHILIISTIIAYSALLCSTTTCLIICNPTITKRVPPSRSTGTEGASCGQAAAAASPFLIANNGKLPVSDVQEV